MQDTVPKWKSREKEKCPTGQDAQAYLIYTSNNQVATFEELAQKILQGCIQVLPFFKVYLH